MTVPAPAHHALDVEAPRTDAIIREGDSAIVFGGEIFRVVMIRGNAIIKLGRHADIRLSSLVGQRFNRYFCVDEKAKTLAESDEVPDQGEVTGSPAPAPGPVSPVPPTPAVGMTVETVSARDNRNLVANNKNQTLTQDQIIAMQKSEGMTGIVDKLVENSSTFDDKTAFAQAKYIRKKQKKYAMLFFVGRVTPDALAEMFCPTSRTDTREDDGRGPMRMRVDSISQALAFGNVNYDTRILLWDKSNGVLAAAALDRLGWYQADRTVRALWNATEKIEDGDADAEASSTIIDGRVECRPIADLKREQEREVLLCGARLFNVLPPKAQPAMQHARAMLLPYVKRRWSCVPLRGLLDGGVSGAAGDAQPLPGSVKADEPPPTAYISPRAEASRFSQWLTGQTATRTLAEAPADCLLFADDEESGATVAATVLGLLPHVAPSGQLVVYSPFLETLCEVFRRLPPESVVCATIRDTWMREYQVLPGRTHPTVNMSHAGGYILHAIRVEPLEITQRKETAVCERPAAETVDEPAMKKLRSEAESA